MTADDQNKAFYWATTFIRELYTNGINQVVISPGSRSTPLTLAAGTHPGIDSYVVLDERSAAFTALGMAKHSGRPAVLICTSGTAAANYYPAVIEARHSGVPLLVLTADRPPHLRNIGASQAIDQLKMFGDYPVFFHEVGEPILKREDLERLKTVADQGIRAAIKHKGPSHINFPFRKPLEPSPEYLEEIENKNKQHRIKSHQPKTTVYSSDETMSVPGEVKKILGEANHPVVIEGPTGIATNSGEAGKLAHLLKAPLLSEFPSTPTNSKIRGFDGFLKSKTARDNLQPDLVVRFGQQPVSKALQLYLKQFSDIPHIHFGQQEEWQDATHSVTHRVEWYSKKINWTMDRPESSSGWLEKWREIDQAFDDYKLVNLNSENILTDGHLFHQLGSILPDNWNVFLSNSFPVRDWMLFAGSPARPTYTNRGASGIDGIISTAIGATISSQQPGVLFIGDLATLHDSNALLSSRFLKQPLVIILLNNGGGNIFRMLPIFQHKKLYTDLFETPQQVNFKSFADTHELNFRLITSISELNQLQFEQFNKPGIHLVECQTDSEASMKLRNTLWNFSS